MRQMYSTIIPANSATKATTPTAIPAMAPVDKVEGEGVDDGEGVGLEEGAEDAEADAEAEGELVGDCVVLGFELVSFVVFVEAEPWVADLLFARSARSWGDGVGAG